MAQLPTHRRSSPLAAAALIAIAVVALQALLIPLFAAPSAHLEPRDLPVVVAGPAPAAEGLAAQLRAARPGGFEIAIRPDAAAADRALRDREAYAAFVLGAGGMSLHTAPAAGPTVATLLTQAATQLAAGQPVSVVDVVPLDPDDPRGTGFAAGFLPLALTSMIVGMVLFVLARGRGARVTGLLTFAALAGPVVAAVLQFWLGVLPGNYPLNATAVGLLTLAVAGSIAGLGALLGVPGAVAGVLLVFMAGNALSAVSSAPELLPQPWGELGQWLPLGAGGSLMRSAAYFDGAGAAGPLWILIGYAAAGLLLVWFGRAAGPRRGAAGAPPTASTGSQAGAAPGPAVTSASPGRVRR